MGTLYITIILLCRIVQPLFSKPRSDMISGLRMFLGYSVFKNFVCSVFGLCLVLLSGAALQADLLTIAIAVFSGLSMSVASYAGVLALKSGTIALNAMFSSAGLIVPCIAGIFMFNAPLSILQWCGLGVFLISSWLLTSDAQKTCQTFRPKTILVLLLSLLSNGSTMLAQQLFTHFRPNGNISLFSLLSFGIVGLFMLILFICTGSRKQESAVRLPGKLLFCGVFLAAALFVINQLSTAATAVVEPVVLFSFITCGGTIIGAIIAHLFFNEKITLRKALGIAVGILSLIIIKVF